MSSLTLVQGFTAATEGGKKLKKEELNTAEEVEVEVEDAERLLWLSRS